MQTITLKTPALLVCALLLAGSLRSQIAVTPAPIHIHYSSDGSKIMDDQMLRYLAKYTNPVTIRGSRNSSVPPKWNNPKGYWDSTLFARLKQLNPSLITALYSKLELWNTIMDSTFDYETLHGMNNLGVSFLVPDANNGTIPMLSVDSFFYGDTRTPEFRNWILGRLDTSLNITVKSDGFCFDHTWYNPVPYFFPAPYNTDSGMIKSYRDSNYTLVKQVKTHFPSAYLQVNGNSPYTYMEQIKLLDYADAENVEAFGITEYNDSNFYTAVLPYIRMLDTPVVANKRFNIYGTAHGSGKSDHEYVSYQKEENWERYLYGCFLLGTSGKSGFNFRSSYYYPLRTDGRFGELDLHTDYIYNRLGNAVDHFSVTGNGLYIRHFENGFVLVAPTDPVANYTYTLQNTCYDNEGNAYSGDKTLSSGEAYIFFTVKQPSLPCTYEVNFEDSTNGANFIGYGLSGEPNAIIKKEKNKNHYISFTALTAATGYDIFEHDIMLDWVRYHARDSVFSFTYKTKKANADIQVFCEVDDTASQKYYNAILNFSVKVPKTKNFDVGYAYRSLLYNTNSPKNIPNIQSSITLINDGNWHAITVNGSELSKAGVKFIRPHFMRVKGAIDLDNIIVYHTNNCSTGFQFAKSERKNYNSNGR